MKFLDEYRDEAKARTLLERIEARATRSWTLMEVCGGQTHSIVKYGIDHLLPSTIELLHGPGCPVCVTPLELIDQAHAIATRPGVILCSFGDMLRVPGSQSDLLALKATGADIRTVYSPLDALKLAQEHPDRQVVFFAIGFETTAPANAMAVWLAQQRDMRNFSVLVSHVLVPPALVAILEAPDNRVQGFLGPGHVCTVMGTEEYRPVADRYQVPIVTTGFEPVDLLVGIYELVCMLEAGEVGVKNAYARVVKPEGNAQAQALIKRVFEVSDRKWRGIGPIDASGYTLRPAFRAFDAAQRFTVETIDTDESPVCVSGDVLRGRKKPNQCPAFGTTCTPETPLGATMVSSEGACAAYYHYGRINRGTTADEKSVHP